MKPPASQLQEDRQPGRSFDDPSKPLGTGILAHSAASANEENGDFRSREAQADIPNNGVAERAKVIAVLRKVEELAADNNPQAFDEASLLRVYELAASRVGTTVGEYHALVKGDAELIELEQKVLSAVRARFR